MINRLKELCRPGREVLALSRRASIAEREPLADVGRFLEFVDCVTAITVGEAKDV
jgi:hypothetical protein